MSLDGYIAGPQRRVGNDAKSMGGITNIVLSRILRQEDYPRVRIETDAARVVKEPQTQPGKDIAIFGGGELFRSLLAEGLVDRIEMALIPVLLGGGVPLLPPPAGRARLELRGQRVYQKTGTISLGAYIDNLHVVPEWHGRGLADALMRHAAEWVCHTQPGAGVYLFVMEANARARASYDRLGARNVEVVHLQDPGGGSAPNCRYVWADARELM